MDIQSLITLVTPLLAAVVAYAISAIKTKSIRERVKSIEEALQSDENEYIIYCPHCNQKIYLSKVKIVCERKKNE